MRYYPAPSGSQQQRDGNKLLFAAGAALLYAGSAIAMNFSNKATLQLFGLSNTLLTAQMVATIAVIALLQAVRVLKFPAFRAHKAKAMLPLSLLYTANTAFALLGLRVLTIPMYSTLKRLTPMMVLAAKAVMTKQAPQWSVTASVACVVVGCIIAGLGDLKFDISGYVFALLSCSLQAAYLLVVENSGTEKGSSTAELLYYNAIISVPFLLLVVLVTGEWKEVVPAFTAAAARVGWHAWLALFVSCSLMGCLLNFSLFLCTIVNSALTTTVVGALKGVLVTVLGFFLLGGVEFHAVNVVGISFNTVGGIWYTVIKYSNKRQNRRNDRYFIPVSASMEPLVDKNGQPRLFNGANVRI